MKSARAPAAIVLLACAIGASSQAPWLTRWLECERREVLCGDAIEADALAANPSHARRTGHELYLNVESAPDVGFADTRSENSSTQIFRYLGELAPFHRFVVHVQHYEGDEFLLVNRSDGSVIRVPAVPVPSPDGRRFAVASGTHADYNANRVEVWQVTGARLKREWVFEPKEWGARLPEWDSASQFRACKVYFTPDEVADPKCQCQPIVVYLGSSGWAARDESACRATSR